VYFAVKEVFNSENREIRESKPRAIRSPGLLSVSPWFTCLEVSFLMIEYRGREEPGGEKH
jgi:hypothetical protein